MALGNLELGFCHVTFWPTNANAELQAAKHSELKNTTKYVYQNDSHKKI